MTGKEKRAGIIGGLVFVGLGIAAVLNPHLMDNGEPSGRNFLTKLIFVYLWSRPGGVIAIILGCASIWNAIKPSAATGTVPSTIEPQATTLKTIQPIAAPKQETDAAANDDRKYAPPGYFDNDRQPGG